MDSTTTMRAAMRNGTDPKTKINWMGFRCAQDAKEDAGAKVSLTKE
jgi:sulfatase modifying factor 1